MYSCKKIFTATKCVSKNEILTKVSNIFVCILTFDTSQKKYLVKQDFTETLVKVYYFKDK